MPLVGFEPTISAGERPKTYALDRAATGAGVGLLYHTQIASVLDRTGTNKTLILRAVEWKLQTYVLRARDKLEASVL